MSTNLEYSVDLEPVTPVPELIQLHETMCAWRKGFHEHPELGFEEFQTSDFIAKKLQTFGVEVHRGLAETGVVGTLRNGKSARKIALRADMDALPILEENDFLHSSKIDGKMHACGHDGHMAMLLGAAKHLSETRNFDGTVYFVFQPAEEGMNGGKRMVDDGLFDVFPASQIYGMHNFPSLQAGKLATNTGNVMAAMDVFSISVSGIGGHGGMPHLARSPVLAACKLVSALYEYVTYQISPLHPVTLNVAQIHAGDADNVISKNISISGTVRSLNEPARMQIKEAFPQITRGISEAYGVEGHVNYTENYPMVYNSDQETKSAVIAAESVVGTENVNAACDPITGSEDFAWMLRERPGNFIFIGNGIGENGGTMVHNSRYDFNDEILPTGASYWVRLTEHLLSSKRQ